MPPARDAAEMGFFDHLEILRKGIVACLILFILAAGVFFFFMDSLMPTFLRPVERMGIKLYALTPYEKFLAYMKASALLGAGTALPAAAGLAAGFISPALARKTRKSLVFMLTVLLLFSFAGIALAWFFLLPVTVRFFSGFAVEDGIAPLWSLGSYISLASGLIGAVGLVCLLPPLLLFLIRLGALRASTLAKGRRHAIVGIAIVAGLLTPTVDVFTQIILGFAMWALFELTLLLGRLVERKTFSAYRQAKEDLEASHG
jgi:sec-independent protein translocase protein TatC